MSTAIGQLCSYTAKLLLVVLIMQADAGNATGMQLQNMSTGHKDIRYYSRREPEVYLPVSPPGRFPKQPG